MTNELSQELKDKVLEMPEYRQGVNKVKVRLKDGTVVNNVYIAWGHEIVKVKDSDKIPFDARDIVDIENDL
jgi:hypothetical protein